MLKKFLRTSRAIYLGTPIEILPPGPICSLGGLVHVKCKQVMHIYNILLLNQNGSCLLVGAQPPSAKCGRLEPLSSPVEGEKTLVDKTEMLSVLISLHVFVILFYNSSIVGNHFLSVNK